MPCQWIESKIGWTILLAKLCSKHLGLQMHTEVDLVRQWTLEGFSWSWCYKGRQCLRTVKATWVAPLGHSSLQQDLLGIVG